MYIHLGSDIVVNMKNVIGIFDMEKTTVSKITKEYLRAVSERGSVINVSTELPRSYIVCEVEGKNVIYISQISPATLSKRCGFIDDISLK